MKRKSAVSNYNIKSHYNVYILCISESYMFIPTFVDLTSKDVDENRKKLLDANVQYPFGKCSWGNNEC